jgi:hypothetical protein
MRVLRDRTAKTIKLSQQTYVEKMLATYKLEQCRPEKNPFYQHNYTLTYDKENGETNKLNQEQHNLFRAIVGSLLYAANMTRVDIAFSVGVLCRQLATPNFQHLHGAKHVLRYLSATSGYCMLFSASHPSDLDGETPLVTYTDSDWANNPIDSKSTSGALFKLFGNVTTWISRRQSIVALSSTEAEYIAASEAAKESLWTRQWLSDVLGHSYLKTPTRLLCDNQSAISIASSGGHHQRTKHINVRFHHLRDHVAKGDIKLVFVTSELQLADILTKHVTPLAKFVSAVASLMCIDAPVTLESDQTA